MKSLTIEEFGDALLRTQDLDPVYVALANGDLSNKQMAALLVSYFCFYHLGAAAYMAEWAEGRSGAKLWALLMEAAKNELRPFKGSPTERWPRSAERRHFRGAQAIDAVHALSERYPKGPEWALEGLLGVGKGRMTYHTVSAAAQGHRGFGPWIAFKIADISERVLRYNVDFSQCELGIYKDPRQGAALAFYENDLNINGERVSGFDGEPWRYPIKDQELAMTVAHYVAYWRAKKAKAPPHRDRLVNVQEIETIFCKYKSHRKGHYEVGKDINEVRHGLGGWGDLAQQLAKGLPPAVLS